jgi:type I restriction enzyme M protein
MNKNKTNSQPLEKTLWQTAEKLRKNMDAAEYKHVVLGLIFLKYISDAFDKLYCNYSGSGFKSSRFEV